MNVYFFSIVDLVYDVVAAELSDVLGRTYNTYTYIYALTYVLVLVLTVYLLLFNASIYLYTYIYM